MTILDSNVWIALLSEADSQHKTAESSVARVKDDVLLPQFIISEVCTVLAQKYGKAAADLFIEYGLNAAGTTIWSADEKTFIQLVEFYRQGKHPGLSFIDVSLLFLSRLYPVITFDRQLARAIKRGH